MTKYEARPQPFTTDATQWFKNGDHPKDNREEFIGSDGKPFLGEGKVVRYYRHPYTDGQIKCDKCGNIMHNHGWIDNQAKDMVVCPGDWVVTGIKGVYYPLKSDEFHLTFREAIDQKEISDFVGQFERLLKRLHGG